MTKLGKKIIAQTFKFSCDRYLRFELASKEERKTLGIDSIELGRMRPGLQLMIDAANKWEADKYQDLIDCAEPGSIIFLQEPAIDPRIGQKPFKEVPKIFDVLRAATPPYAIIEGIFDVPHTVSPAFQELIEAYGIELMRANPDVIWVRPFQTGSPLIRTKDMDPQYELHIIDVKMASEASLKHFTEVTFYAFALAEAIKEAGLDDRYQVSAQGLIWPGTHDNNKFRNMVREFTAKGATDPVSDALIETLDEVPYEVYEVHVRKFLDEHLLAVLKQQPLDASWHVSSKCQLCQYFEFCSEKAKSLDHLSRIAWLNLGQATLLRQNGIHTTRDLYDAIHADSGGWKRVKLENYQIKADQLMLAARSKALHTEKPEIIDVRKSGMMPNWVDMSIYLTIHFDPGTGLTFAMGAKRVYFKRNRESKQPDLEERTFIIDRVDNMNPDTERNRLIEFIDLVTTWLLEADSENKLIRAERQAKGERDSDFGKVTAHFFFWNQLETRQLLRMIERHMTDPQVVDRVELLVRLFPPESMLPPDVEAFKSQPGTIVKDVVRQLVGLPISYDYNLIEVANTFFPFIKEDNTPFEFKTSFGFHTPLNDQIPFERAYELWKDNIFLKHYSKRDGTEYTDSEKQRGLNKYTRGDILAALERTLKTHLNALQHVVMGLREKCGPQLVLKKSSFSAQPVTQKRVPEKARQLIAFQNLDSFSHEVESNHNLSLPLDEREARFISMRGLMFADGSIYDDAISRVLEEDPTLQSEELHAFTFSEESRDAKLKEGDFLCALTNEDSPAQLNIPWYRHLDISFTDGQALMDNAGLSSWYHYKKVRDLLQMTIVRLYATEQTPFVILKINNARLFHFAIRQGIIDPSKPMVLDPYYKDFDSAELENVLYMIGGRAPQLRRR